MNIIKERVRQVRTKLNLTMEAFGRRLGVTRTAISNIEAGNRGVTEQMLKSICREFDVNEEWLRTGEGKMFRELPEEEEVASLVSDMLEDGKNNPLYEVILEIMRTYNELSPKSQEVLREASGKLLKNLRKRKEG